MTSYDSDIAAWSDEQARLIRAGRFDLLDLEHLADEIEDVGKSERRELASRLAVLLAHLLKWQHQPERRGASWEATIRHQRDRLRRRLDKAPSLRPLLVDPDWIADAWDDAIEQASAENGAGVDTFPDNCPWSPVDVLQEGWTPRA